MKVAGALLIALQAQFLAVSGRAPVVCPGFKLTRLGCYNENPSSPALPVVLFTDRDTKSPMYTKKTIPWKEYDGYMAQLICRCAKASSSKGQRMFGLYEYGDCRTGPGAFGKHGNSKASCITFGSRKCQTGNDCVGEKRSSFVYLLQSVPSKKAKVKPQVATKPPVATKPTVATKPPGATKPAITLATTAKATPTAATPNKVATLVGQNFIVGIKVKKIVVKKKPFMDRTRLNAPPAKNLLATPAPTVTTAGKTTKPAKPPPSPEMIGLENKIKAIYKGYPCLYCVKALRSSTAGSTVTVYVRIQFRCVSQHLAKLGAAVGAKNIVKAAIDPPTGCPRPGTHSTPCGTRCSPSACQSSSSYAQLPSTCGTTMPAPVSYPAPYSAPYPAPAPMPVSYPAPYSPCPAICSTACTSACSPSCCRSKVKKHPQKGSKKSDTHHGDAEDEDDDEVNDEDDRDDDYDEQY